MFSLHLIERLILLGWKSFSHTEKEILFHLDKTDFQELFLHFWSAISFFLKWILTSHTGKAWESDNRVQESVGQMFLAVSKHPSGSAKPVDFPVCVGFLLWTVKWGLNTHDPAKHWGWDRCCCLGKGWKPKSGLTSVTYRFGLSSTGCWQCQEISSFKEWQISPLPARWHGLCHGSLSLANDYRVESRLQIFLHWLSGLMEAVTFQPTPRS